MYARCGLFSDTRGVVCVLDRGGEARAQACSVRSFSFEDKLPCIQIGIIIVFEDASGFNPLLLFRAVACMFVKGVIESEEPFGLDVGGVIEVLAPLGLAPISFHGRSDSALQAR